MPRPWSGSAPSGRPPRHARSCVVASGRPSPHAQVGVDQRIVTGGRGTVDGPFGVNVAGVRPQGVPVQASTPPVRGRQPREESSRAGPRGPALDARSEGDYLWMTMFPPAETVVGL